MTAYNGNAITYDQIGNPLTYYNGTTFTWYRGRKLETATTAEGTSLSYSYDDSGIRTRKTVNGVATDYFLDGSKIVADKTASNTTWYYYDGDGTREAIEYKGNVYYYFYNAQGDVMGLFDNNLNIVVNYTYDSVIIVNSCDSRPNAVNRELKTTKSNSHLHGLGLKSVMKLLKKYKGDLEWEYSDELKEFTTTVILK